MTLALKKKRRRERYEVRDDDTSLDGQARAIEGELEGAEPASNRNPLHQQKHPPNGGCFYWCRRPGLNRYDIAVEGF